MQHSSTVLEVHDLSVSYRKKRVLWGIDFELEGGTLTSIIGPNGAGKSTLIKAILGLVKIDSGFVKIFNESPKKSKSKISYVPQRESVDWDYPATVFDVALMGRYAQIGWFKRPSKKDREIAKKCLRDVGIDHLADRQISQLSGGQQQRVFLARALAQEADLYLMDEPFAGVDVATEEAIIGLLRTLKEQGKTVVVVHHDLQTAMDYFDHMIMLNQRLVAYGPTKEVFNTDLLQKTYGGKLSILSKLGLIIEREQFPTRE